MQSAEQGENPTRLNTWLRKMLACACKQATGWLYVFKITLAALMAMWISMRFELGQPVTAIVTVYLVMQPQSGQVWTKSIYRIVGTLGGATACLLLFALFPQQRVLFLLGLSLWVGICTAGASLLRNFTCYAFVLAGYTAAMIGMATIANPANFFSYAVNRSTEVMIGIICAGLVSDLIFPRSLGPMILRTVRNCYTEFIDFTHALWSQKVHDGDIRQRHLRFIGNILSLEALRGAAFWEASPHLRRDACLRHLNASFMAMSTTAHSLHQLMRRLKKSGSRAAPELDALLATLDAALQNERRDTFSAPTAADRARSIAALRSELPLRVKTFRASIDPEADRTVLLDFVTGTELIERFVGDLLGYTGHYVALHDNGRNNVSPKDIRFVARTDPAMAILNGVRAMLAVLLVAVFWILTAWPYGASAVMMVAIACALFASTPDPARAINLGLLGGCIALPFAFICNFLILPAMDGFLLLSAALTPFLLASAWLMSLTRKTMMIGLGFCCMFCFMISPGNTMQYNPVKLINFGLSQVLGQAAAAAMFAIFAPVTSPWFKRRLPAMLRSQMRLACFAAPPNLTERFESGTRDIMQRISAAGTTQDAYTRHTIDWMFLVLETGRTIIHLRSDAQKLPPIWQKNGVDPVIHAVATLFRKPATQHHQCAVAAVNQTLRSLADTTETLNDKRTLDSVITALHYLRLTLLDEAEILTAKIGGTESAA